MSDLDDAERLFRAAGLGFPTVPSELVGDFRKQRDWCYATRPVEISPYDVRHYVAERMAGGVSDYVVLAHAGHGLNSYAMQYYVSRGPLGLFVHRSFGGVYEDATADAEKVRGAFALADQIVSLADTSWILRGRARLIVVATDFYGSWSELRDENGQLREELALTADDASTFLGLTVRWLSDSG